MTRVAKIAVALGIAAVGGVGIWYWSSGAETPQSETAEEAVPEEGPTPVLRGRIVDGGHRPVAGAEVQIATADGDRVGTKTTDDEGRFVWYELDAGSGTYRLDVDSEGRVVAGPPPAKHADVEIPAAGGREGPVEVELRVLRPATLEGRVLAGGEPLGGVDLTVYYLYADGLRGAVDPYALSGVATTDDRGRFSIDDVAPGRLRLVAEPDAYAARESREYLVEPGDTVDGIVVDVDPTGVLVGSVTSEEGEQLEGVDVRLGSSRRDLERRGETDGEGRFEFGALQPGSYRVRFLASGHHVRTLEGVAVRADEKAQKQVELQTASGLFGQVVDPEGEPVPGAFLRYRRNDGQTKWGRAVDRGRFEWSSPTGGGWTVRAFHPAYGSSEPVVLTEDEPAVVDLGDGGRVVGRVVDADGQPVEGARVGVGAMRLTGARPWGPRAVDRVETDERGAFEFDSLRPGNYTFRAKTERGTSPESSAIRVEAGETTEGVELTVGLDGTIVGTVRRKSDGAPIEGAKVALNSMDSPFESASATTDGEGRFRLRGVPAGRRSISVKVDGYLERIVSGLRVPSGAEIRREIEMRRKKKGERFGFQGIGASLQKAEEGVRVRRVLPGGGAEEAGLQKGDYIRAVDRERVDDLPLTEIIQQIRGRGGEPVQLTIERDGRRKTMEIVRDRVVVEERRN